MQYSLQANAKDRRKAAVIRIANAQFEYGECSGPRKILEARVAGPFPSIRRKKELVGKLQQWRAGVANRKENRRRLLIHDFADKELGKVIPYGV